MTFDVEIMLRANEHVFTERLSHDREPAAWTDQDVDAILRKVLQAIDRALNPGADEARPVSLRGLSWIVSPYHDGVVLAFEIHSASAVAGPFQIAQADLDHMVRRVLRGAPGGPAVH